MAPVSQHTGCRTMAVRTGLLEYLRQGLDQPSFMEVTEHLNEYLKANRRRTGESINEYLARKNEIYLRAQHALQRRSTSSNHKSQAQHGSLLPGGIDLQRTHVSRRTSMESQPEPDDDGAQERRASHGSDSKHGGPTPRGVAVRSMVPGPATGWMVGPGPTDQRGARQPAGNSRTYTKFRPRLDTSS